MCFELQFFAQNSVRTGRRARMVDVTSSTPDLPELRRDYVSEELTEEELAEDWPTQFGRWLAAAVSAGLAEPNAMVLATADAAGRPSARSGPPKGDDGRGFGVFTHHQARNG